MADACMHIAAHLPDLRTIHPLSPASTTRSTRTTRLAMNGTLRPFCYYCQPNYDGYEHLHARHTHIRTHVYFAMASAVQHVPRASDAPDEPDTTSASRMSRAYPTRPTSPTPLVHPARPA